MPSSLLRPGKESNDDPTTAKKSQNPLPMKERMKIPRQLMPEQPAGRARPEL